MHASNLQRERELFERCVDQPAEEWEQILLQACPDDEELRARVLRLLQKLHRAVLEDNLRVLEALETQPQNGK